MIICSWILWAIACKALNPCRLDGAGTSRCAPDYWIRVRTVLSEGDTVLATGEAGGTIDGFPWRTPAAWEAVIRSGFVSEWRVFADNKPIYEILARRGQ